MAENKEDIDKFANYQIQESEKSSQAQENAPAAQGSAASTKAAATPKEEIPVPPSPERVYASPIAKKIASENDIPLDKVHGTGPHGRIIKSDVQGYQPVSKPATTAVSTPAPASIPSAPTPVAGFSDIPLSNVRKVIAQRLTESKSTVPHYYLTIEVNVDKILKYLVIRFLTYFL